MSVYKYGDQVYLLVNMNEASTEDNTAYITRCLKSTYCFTHLKIDYFVDDTEMWIEVLDLDEGAGVNWDEKSKRTKYANWGKTPLNSNINFSVINDNSKYTPGSGESEEGTFALNTRVRIRAGYAIPAPDAEQPTILSTSFFYFTKFDVDKVILDITGTDDIDSYFQDLFSLYTTPVLYTDEPVYKPNGYVVQVIERDLLNCFDGFRIKTSETGIYNIYYRYSSSGADTNLNTLDWISLGTSNGEKTFELPNSVTRFLYVGIIFDGTDWGPDADVTEITAIGDGSQVDYFYKRAFYLDSPSFSDPPVGQFPMVNIKGRDIFKRITETTIQPSDLSAGVSLDQLVKDTADKANVKYSATSIIDLSSFGNRTLEEGLDKPIKAIDFLEMIMQIANKSTGSDARYQMYTAYDDDFNDNILFLQQIPTNLVADFVFNFNHYISIADRKENYDKALKRITVISDKNPVSKEVLISTDGPVSGLVTAEFSVNNNYKRLEIDGTGTIEIDDTRPRKIDYNVTSGSLTIKTFGSTWGGKINSPEFTGNKNDCRVSGKYIGGGNDVFFIEITGTFPDTFRVNKNGGDVLTGVVILLDPESEDAGDSPIKGQKQYLIDGIYARFAESTGHSINDRWTFTTETNEPQFQGEAINADNTLKGLGSTGQLVNPLLISNTEAHDVAKGTLEDFGQPILEGNNLVYPYLNLLLEINDNTLLWSNNLFVANLFPITGISHHWDRNDKPNQSSTYSLADSGNSFDDVTGGDYEYDTILKYDIGLVYDMALGPQAKEGDVDLSKYYTAVGTS